ncbi:electron transfer flavoprotein subunit alpha/FixB family protein [Membranicola marinus]|uniref:Electron transfer flavoprotein subunit alpha/FixB family protein n=1 Tax=Membranihabitans marinus TaxID=1227546 RepID=A0A953HLH7_9BACT|nr:electron transfer flavoprotein subunit alpha/FixB family protein [Membranihabitans marinus]MBY5957289.1 electron transfer flavoprotein subunit alpha/FixB family protein [Membranihabitans marinus]
MSVLVFCEYSDDGFKKFTREAMTYGVKLSESLSSEVIAIVNDPDFDQNTIQHHGISQVVTYSDVPLGDSQSTAQVISEIATQKNAKVVIIPFNSTGKNIAGQVAVQCGGGIATSVSGLPLSVDPLTVPVNVFAGKATAEVTIENSCAILAIQSNSIATEEKPVDGVHVESYGGDQSSAIKIIERKTVTDDIPLPEAELVVSGGRGLKGPENWNLVTDLANALGAATACSRPVADSDWRPHYEHVGQTGVTIRPNLYIAAGISGAIQHLGGVNNSKTIVVINKDPEAPFFKAADYGVIGDLFEVLPRLTDAVRKFKSE